MRLYAHLLFAVLVLRARAATIPDNIHQELLEEKKLPSILPEDTKLPAENVSSEQELIDPANTVKDVENNLRNTVQAVEDIPVKVIVDGVESLVRTSGEDKDIAHEVPEEEIVRPLIDLRNPGPPQRQEHETQNPEHHKEAKISASSVKHDIQETQLILRQGFQGVTEGIQNWYAHNDQVTKLQSSIESLKENFSTQVQKLNETLQGLFKSRPVESPEDEAKTRASLEKIETRLNILQNNFTAGVKSLTEGVHVVASLRAEGGDTASTSSTSAPAPGFNPFNNLVNLFTNFQNSVSSGMANMTQAINSIITNNNPGWNLNFLPGASTAPPQADASGDTGTTTQRPSPWQTLQNSFSNIINPGQQNQTAQPSQPTGPFAAIQNIPNQIIQNIQNFINRPNQSAEKPAAAATAAPASNQPGSNVVPAVPTEHTESKPEPEKKPEGEKQPEAEKKPEPATGPIRQILEKNPVVQGLANAVQRIQTSINNPEKPRDTAEKNETEQEKGGLIFVGGHRPGGGGSGDNNDIGSRLKSEVEEQKETVTEQKSEVVEEIPAMVSDKTE